jgi:Cu/Ag efflux pump CusA
MVSATILALLVIPAIYAVVKGVALRRAGDRHPETQAAG